MNKRFVLGLFCSLSLAVSAQQSFMIDKNVAVFYPADFNAGAHLPSMAFTQELVPQGNVAGNWKIRPVFSQENGKSVAVLNVGADDDLYGTGEVIGDLRRNGKEVVFWNKDNYGYMANEGKNLYQTHPWVLGLRKDGSAYGIIADNTWKGTCTTGNQIKFSFESPAFRVVVIEGKDSKEVMKELAKLTGTMELPPMWALGMQQCRYSYYPDTRVKEIVDSLRIKRIPNDVVWMDIDYMDKFKVFTFDPQTFPDPKGLQKYVNAKNMKCVYMIDPGVGAQDGYFVYDQGKAGNFFVKNADGTTFQGRVWPGECNFPDYTRPEVRLWWSKLTADHMKMGVDGLWNDMNDPSVFGGVDVTGQESGTMIETARHQGGYQWPADSHLRYHNLYGTFMIQASREGMLMANPNKRPFVLSRSNFLGGQRYGATWNGDNMSCWEHLLQSIPMTLNLGLSGQPFNGPDMGGFGADCDPELLAHWYAMGIYFPFARNHAAKGTVNQEPWAFGERVENICRTAVERRYRLMPYIYTLFQEASTDGMPVMRPIFMADEKDANLRGEQKVYMLGGDLIIIPRFAKDAAIPAGDWDIIQFEEKDDLYQAFVAQRPGSVVPTCEVAQSTADLDFDTLTLLVNPDADGNAVGTYYEDAKDGYSYKDGDYSMYELKATTVDGNVKVTINQVAGQRKANAKKIRIGLVCDGKVTYSPFVEGNEVSIKNVKEKEFSINMKKLKWSAIDPATQPTLGEKLKIQMEKMAASGQANEW
ncbi:MAG: glycoside hydrolase family 31 protein [Bacteroidales bacterium]|nr:glycoside hydrolase family 31 protein [Bacteroidales bacterium]